MTPNKIIFLISLQNYVDIAITFQDAFYVPAILLVKLAIKHLDISLINNLLHVCTALLGARDVMKNLSSSVLNAQKPSHYNMDNVDANLELI